MDKKSSSNSGCLIAVLVLLGAGALLLYMDFLAIVVHSVPPFCTGPECEPMRRFLYISAISCVAALSCSVLSALTTGPRVLPIAAIGAAIISIVAGIGTGIGMWALPNALFTLVITFLLLLLAADQ